MPTTSTPSSSSSPVVSTTTTTTNTAAAARSLLPPKFDTTEWDCRECVHPIDEDALQTWIYPNNRPVRDYQYDIIRVALFVNTLACLPTGLGKTFIATVVMYNYYRWFPNTKIVFACPTKPLVSQQLKAYREMVDTPIHDTVELTGELRPEARSKLWREKRVFFLTPQTMHRDLLSGICPREQISCLVIDEAHKATGNFAYCEIARALREYQVRLLALTATPGGDPDVVQSIVENLRISRIEIRTEETDQVRRYTYDRQLDVQTIPITGPIANIRQLLSNCIRPIIDRTRGGPGIEFYNKDPGSVAPFQVIKAMQNYRGAMGRNASPKVIGDLMTLHRLAYSMDLMLQHGIRSFLVAIAPLKGAITKDPTFNECLRVARAAVKVSTAPSHPKVTRLISIIRGHFEQHERQLKESGAIGSECRDTRVMVFSEYRESVSELVDVLNAYQPLIRASQFIGRGTRSSGKKKKKTNSNKRQKTNKSSKSAKHIEEYEEEEEPEEGMEEGEGTTAKNQVQKGFGQKEQQKVLDLFKSGYYNTLVATSIGEEGLDIGDVDLIICFDAQSSPTRMLQRMGRTGRHREGRIVILLTEGKEASRYAKSRTMYKNVQRAIMDPDCIRMCPGNPRILPENVKPQCHFKAVNSAISSATDNGVINQQHSNSHHCDDSNDTTTTTAKLHLFGRSIINSSSKSHSTSAAAKKYAKDPYLSEIEEEEWRRRYYMDNAPKVNFSRFTVRQTRVTPTHLIEHTRDTLDFVRLMYSIDELVLDNDGDVVSDYEAIMCRHLLQSDLWQATIDGNMPRSTLTRSDQVKEKSSKEDSLESINDIPMHLEFPTAPSNMEDDELASDPPDYVMPSAITATPSSIEENDTNMKDDMLDDDGFPLSNPSLWMELLDKQESTAIRDTKEEKDDIISRVFTNTCSNSNLKSKHQLLPSHLYLTELPDLSALLRDTSITEIISDKHETLNVVTTSMLPSESNNEFDSLDDDLLMALDQASLDSLDLDCKAASPVASSPPSSLPIQRGAGQHRSGNNPIRRLTELSSSPPLASSLHLPHSISNEVPIQDNVPSSSPIEASQRIQTRNPSRQTGRMKAHRWFEMEAEVSGTDASADEDENDDRDHHDLPNSFIADDADDDDDADEPEETAVDISNFYRESLLSQADNKFGGRRGLFGGAGYTMRYSRPSHLPHQMTRRYTNPTESIEDTDEDMGSLADFIADSSEKEEVPYSDDYGSLPP
ncbi:hypothetical protein BDF22DRAFT_671143, partial [Syncephalis plumigaleata]